MVRFKIYLQFNVNIVWQKCYLRKSAVKYVALITKVSKAIVVYNVYHKNGNPPTSKLVNYE